MYSDQRIVSKFKFFVGREPTDSEVSAIRNSSDYLSVAISKIANIVLPPVMVVAGAHCKTCDHS